MYGVRKAGGCAVSYVELAGTSLILRPHNPDYSVEVSPIQLGQTAAELIVGRVAHIALET